MEESPCFRDHFEAFTFENRAEKILQSGDKDLNIDMIFCEDKPPGYCISSFSAGKGEIDSIYMSPELRDRNIGRELIGRSLHWLKKTKGCTRILLAVSYRDESVSGFYEKFSFYPRYTCLEKKQRASMQIDRTK